MKRNVVDKCRTSTTALVCFFFMFGEGEGNCQSCHDNTCGLRNGQTDGEVYVTLENASAECNNN